MGKAHWVILGLLILLISSVYAQESSQPLVCQAGMTTSDKAYFDGLNQKTIAQLSAKMDAQVLAIERNLKTEVNNAREQVKYEIVAEIKGALKSIVIGLGGIIIVVLAVFRLLEYKLQHTKRIKKYENELVKKTKEFDVNLKNMQEQMKDNNILKNELLIYKQSLDKYSVSLGIQPQTNLKQGKTEIDIPLPPKVSKRFFTKKNLLKMFLVIIFISFIIYFVYNQFFSGAKLV